MLTVVIRRDSDANTVQLTQRSILKELWQISGSELLLEDSWEEGLRKTRTPYVCLVESDCVLSAGYLTSNYGIMKKMSTGQGLYHGGGYTRLAMLASCLGIARFDNRIYSYKLTEVTEKNEKQNLEITNWWIKPYKQKINMKLYPVQVGFLPGAILRMASIADIIDKFKWDGPNLLKTSSDLSFHFWNTYRRVEVNPNTTYVSMANYLENPPYYKPNVPEIASNIFRQQGL